MMYLGQVVRVVGSKLFVTAPSLGGTNQFGPINALDTPEQSVGIKYAKGDRVLVAQLGSVREDLIVIGKVM